MKRTIRSICFWSLIHVMCLGLVPSSAQEGALRVSEPVDSVVADLESYIPGQMKEAGVPGLAIALIRNNRVVWTDGFGTTNRLTGAPVSSETVFEAASISKVVTAYIALRLVEEDRLSLDRPVHTYLGEPWLPSSASADNITLRHLLSHSSGLGDDIVFRNKRIAFEPGSGFLYSGLGFEYVQELIERVSDETLEEAAREKAFDPLGMSGSSFVGEADVVSNMANGHMPYLLPSAILLLPFIGILAIVGVVILVLHRLIKGAWRPACRFSAGVCAVAFFLAVLLLYIVIGKAFPNLIPIAILCNVVLFALLFLSYRLIRYLISRITLASQKAVLRRTILILWMTISSVALLAVANSLTGPVPENSSSKASAVGSLRATAPDLGAFLIELAHPRHLSQQLASQIDSAQVNINQDFSWGLGVGIQHTTHGDAMWQNAITIAFRGIMVMYPQAGLGVVVLTNSESGLPVAYDVAERAVGGEAKWKYF